MSNIDLWDTAWEFFSFELSSTDAATRAADEDGLEPDDERRVGKPSPAYGERRGYSVPPLKAITPRVSETPDGRWRTYDARKHPDSPKRNRNFPWVLQRRRADAPDVTND